MPNIQLFNDKRSILDLSAVKDAEGKMLILQPKGTTGSSRECPADILEHPHVESVIKANWAHAEKISLVVPVDDAPVETPSAQPPTLQAVLDTVSDTAPAVPPPVDETPEAPALVIETVSEEAQPKVSAVDVSVGASETVEMSESLSTSVVSANDGKSKGKGKGRDR